MLRKIIPPMRKRHCGHVRLSSLETTFNWLIWMALNSLPFYLAYDMSQTHKHAFSESNYLKAGWLGYDKDFNDFEWNFWHARAVEFSVAFSLNFMTIYILKQNGSKYLQEFMILVAMAFHTYFLSWRGLFIVVCQTVCFYHVTLLKKKVYVWLSICLMITGVHNGSVKLFLGTILKGEYFIMVQLAFMMNILRLVSYGCYALEYPGEVRGVFDCLHFALYVPVFFNGPIITYDVFYQGFQKYRYHRQHSSTVSKSSSNKTQAKENIFSEAKIKPNKVNDLEGANFPDIAKDFISCVAYYFAFELFLHFVYMNALSMNHWMLHKMTSLDVVMISWVHLHIFNIKYFIFYRFSGLFAKLDGITPPGPPKCIASLYTFVDMWRYFDKGLYRLLQQCIYIPLGGSKTGIARQIFASCLCFLFVGFWHGGNKTFMFWALTNWLGIVAETLIQIALNSRKVRMLKQQIGPAMYRRLCALGGSFSLYGLTCTNMVFLVGFDGTAILMKRVFVSWYPSLIILLSLYFRNQCSIDVI